MEVKKAIEWIRAINATQNDSSHKNSLVDRKEALHMAIIALERQIPKKPNKRQVGTNILMSKIYYCPTCNKKMYDCALKNGKLDHVSPKSRKSKFCEDCGQAIDWSRDDRGEE